MRKNVLGGIYGAVVLLLFAGCGMTSHQRLLVHDFASATSEFAAVAQEEFVQSRQDVIAMNRMRVLLGAGNVENLDGHFTLERTRVRLQALESLERYGQLLQLLVSTSSAEELQLSADRFVTQLDQVRGIDLDARQAQTIGRLVTIGGGWLVERRRARAIQGVVEWAHPHVLKVIELVESDFDPDDDFWTAGYRRVRLDLDRAVREAGAQTQTNNLAGNQVVRSASMLSRENQQRFDLVSREILQVLPQLRAAEENLHAAVVLGETGRDLAEYRSRVEELNEVVQLLRPENRR